MTTNLPAKKLHPEWRISSEGDCILSWGHAKLRLQEDGTIILLNKRANITLSCDGNILLTSKQNIYLNTNESAE